MHCSALLVIAEVGNLTRGAPALITAFLVPQAEKKISHFTITVVIFKSLKSLPKSLFPPFLFF